MLQTKDRLIVALDVDDLDAAERLMDRLKGRVTHYKLGTQLLTAAGPEAVRRVRRRGFGVFYDAKFHDIPRTAATAVAAACRLGATLVNVHTVGGKEMMRASAQAARDVAAKLKQPKTLVLGVTVLTSLNQRILSSELGVKTPLTRQVVHLAKLAKASGLDGVVASPQEIKLIRQACGRGFVIVTPGIRPSGADLGDQKRTLTPGQAMAAGADYIVIGRPVVEAKDPAAVVSQVQAEMEEACR